MLFAVAREFLFDSKWPKSVDCFCLDSSGNEWAVHILSPSPVTFDEDGMELRKVLTC